MMFASLNKLLGRVGSWFRRSHTKARWMPRPKEAAAGDDPYGTLKVHGP
jgi:hypothetical protein